jgi:hypothetical protein
MIRRRSTTFHKFCYLLRVCTSLATTETAIRYTAACNFGVYYTCVSESESASGYPRYLIIPMRRTALLQVDRLKAEPSDLSKEVKIHFTVVFNLQPVPNLILPPTPQNIIPYKKPIRDPKEQKTPSPELTLRIGTSLTKAAHVSTTPPSAPQSRPTQHSQSSGLLRKAL